MAPLSFASLKTIGCFVLLLLGSNVESRNSKDLTSPSHTNQSLATSSNRKGKFFFDELFGLNAGIGLSNDEDDDDEDGADNNVKTCNCGKWDQLAISKQTLLIKKLI